MNELEKVTLSEDVIANDPAAVDAANVSDQSAAAAAELEAEAVSTRIQEMNKEQLLETMRAIMADNRMDAHREASLIKQTLYNLIAKEKEADFNAHVEAGNTPESFVSAPDELEAEFRTLYNDFKEKRAAYLETMEAQRQANLNARLEIIEKIKGLCEDLDTINTRFPEFKQLQADFKAITDVPAQSDGETWKNFQIVVEQFYDHLKMNKELRDLDFKKNLEAKRLLIVEAKSLSDEPDPVEAFRKLQVLQESWRNIGPVAKELRDEIWNEFKELSTVVYKRHQDHFTARKEEWTRNEEAKEALIAKVEAIDTDAINSHKDWTANSEAIVALQKEWKEIGPAARKVNNELFARFRAACDKFFNAKAEFFKKAKEELQANLEKKTALCEKAEALRDSEDVKAATAEIVKLQNEWKKIGGVPRKVSDALWERFTAACNYFFDLRKKENGERRKEENANLDAKRRIIAEMETLPTDGDRAEVIGRVKELQAEWQNIGHVPFKVKDKIFAEYRALCDKLYEAYQNSARSARMNSFKDRIDGMRREGKQTILSERDKLVRALEARKADLKTIENNMGFFSIKSASGSGLVKEMENKINRLKDDIAQIKEKIAHIDSEN